MSQLQIINNRDEWDASLDSLYQAHILQSWDWGAFKSRWGWQAERLLWTEARRPIAAAQTLRRTIPGTPWNFLYVSKGPVLDYANFSLAKQVLTGLEDYAHQSKALFIKIDPDVSQFYEEPKADPAMTVEGQTWLDILATHGWRFSSEQIQFRNTITLDLSPDTDHLLAAMKSKWRYNIRVAKRKGVLVQPGTIADLDHFYQMYAETAARDGFLIRPEAYYQDVWRLFIETGQAELLLARVEETIVAGLILFFYGQIGWYLYGASTAQHRKLMPNHLLQWQAITQAKRRGCVRYDMWGAPDVFDETDRMWGVYRFKRGFGGQLLRGIGAFDYPVNPLLYRAFVDALPRLRSLLRRIKH